MADADTVRITDPGDPRLWDYRNLRTGTGATESAAPRRPESALGHVVVEGHLALRRCLEGPLRLRSVLMTPARASSLADLRGRLDGDTPVYVADRGVLAELTGFDVHRGVLASADRPEPLDPASLREQYRRIVVLEGLSDLENVGAAFRVAAALGLDAVLLGPGCADPLYRRCVRVSLGWSTVLPHARSQDLVSDLAGLAAAGFSTVALTPGAGALAVDRAANAGVLDDPVALVVGAEGPGLTEQAMAAAGHRVAIPMSGDADSLNAATALAVVASFAAAARSWDRP